MARLLIALALVLGVAVFGLSAFNDLMASFESPAQTRAATNDSDQWGPSHPGFNDTPKTDPLLGNSPTHQRIDHDPGKLPPFPDAERVISNRIKQRNGWVTESANYDIADAQVLDVAKHYEQVAKNAGFRLVMGQPTERAGYVMMMMRGSQQLEVNIAPDAQAAAEPPRPPLIPAQPLTVVVNVHYPIDQADPAGPTTP